MEWFLFTALLFAWRLSIALGDGDECNLPTITYQPNRTIVTASLTRNRYVQHKNFDLGKEMIDRKLRGDITELGVEMPLYHAREMLIHFSSAYKQNILAKIMLNHQNTSDPLKSIQYMAYNDQFVSEQKAVTEDSSPPIHEQFHRLYFAEDGGINVLHMISVGKAGKTISQKKVCIVADLGNVSIDRLLIQVDLHFTIVKKIVVKGYADPPPKKP